MSRKHNTKHRRSRSRYKARLRARGTSRSQMTPYTPEIIEAIRRREGNRR